MPGSPAGGRDGACLLLDHVVRCSSASGAVVRVLTSWGPLLVPGSFNSPATEILSFFLDSFEVVVEWFFFLPLLVAPSLEAPQRVPGRFCGWPLSLWPSGWRLRSSARAGIDVASSPPSVWRTVPSHIPLMLCASTGIYFRSILASSRLSFVWVFGGLVQVFSCLALSVPVGVRSGFALADVSSLWFCLVVRI